MVHSDKQEWWQKNELASFACTLRIARFPGILIVPFRFLWRHFQVSVASCWLEATQSSIPAAESVSQGSCSPSTLFLASQWRVLQLAWSPRLPGSAGFVTGAGWSVTDLCKLYSPPVFETTHAGKEKRKERRAAEGAELVGLKGSNTTPPSIHWECCSLLGRGFSSLPCLLRFQHRKYIFLRILH